MRKLLCLTLVLGAAFATADTPPPARTVVANAVEQAKKENKAVMVIFHASWCGWCKRLDAWMAKPDVKSFFDKEFVVVHLTVLENDPKQKVNENAGGVDMMEAWKGKDAGLPFTVMLDGEGKMVANSNTEKDGTAGNIGCPWKAEEQDWFFGMIQKARPTAPKAQIDALRKSIVEFVKATEAGGGH
jgi:thiol-disulfide isomerase/thioredoxin